MIDKTKNWGGKRPNSGRKSKAEESRLIAIMDDIGDSAVILSVLYENAKNPKNAEDRRLWLAYKYGKPKESLTITDNTIEWIEEDGDQS